jgi:hypothetical protein
MRLYPCIETPIERTHCIITQFPDETVSVHSDGDVETRPCIMFPLRKRKACFSFVKSLRAAHSRLSPHRTQVETARKGVTTAEAEAGSLRVAKAERVAKLGTLQEQLEGISHESASLRDALAEHEHEEVDQAAISVAKARAAELQESLRTYVRKITNAVFFFFF